MVVIITHYAPEPEQTGRRRRSLVEQRIAHCGQRCEPEQHSETPTCPLCAEIVAEHAKADAELAAMFDDPDYLTPYTPPPPTDEDVVQRFNNYYDRKYGRTR